MLIKKIKASFLNKLNLLLNKLSELPFFDNIEYAVVQSGVGLDLGNQINTGSYNPKRLERMIEVCKKYNVKSKEHTILLLVTQYK